PAELNELLVAGELDVSGSSAVEYARHADLLRLLPEIGITSDGPVKSVALFSRRPVGQLDGRTVLLSDSSRTAVALLELLCRDVWAIRPHFAQARVEATDLDALACLPHDAVLVIGDAALVLKARQAYPHRYDLREEWRRWTGLPFEFRGSLELYQRASLLELGRLADAARWRFHPENVVTYIVDRNINYTNVCVADCKFCAFYRRPKHLEGYVLSFEEIGRKIDEVKALGGVQILMQGGHNPYIPFQWYLDLMRYIKRHHPIHIHAFSPSEIDFFAGRFGMTIEEVIRELVAAGLDSVPGGGGEIVVQEVRDRVAGQKAGADRWLEVMETAHRLGLKTSVTMQC